MESEPTARSPRWRMVLRALGYLAVFVAMTVVIAIADRWHALGERDSGPSISR